MAKLIAFLKAASHLDPEQFRDHYENSHVPLVLEIMPGIIDYRRNYLPSPVLGFDVVTEIRFADRDALDKAMRLATAYPGGDRIAEDEARFLDREATLIVFPDEAGGPTT